MTRTIDPRKSQYIVLFPRYLLNAKGRKAQWRALRSLRPPRHKRYKSFRGYLRERARATAQEVARQEGAELSHFTYAFADGVLSLDVEARKRGEIRGPIDVEIGFAL